MLIPGIYFPRVLIAWLAHTALVTLAGMLGFWKGSREVAASGIASQEAEDHRRARKKVWHAISISRFAASQFLSIVFGIGGAAFTNTWLTFSFGYGDPRLAAGTGIFIAGQMAMMFAVARFIAIGKFGKWSLRWPTSKAADGRKP